MAGSFRFYKKKKIIQFRRFIRKNSTKDHSPVLVTSLVTSLPSEIKLWFSKQLIRQFIDRPRQCTKCYKFNDTPCSNPISSPNCDGGYCSNYNTCSSRLQKMGFLNCKRKNFLLFVNARRQFKRRLSECHAKVANEQKTELELLHRISHKFSVKNTNLYHF